MHKCIILSSVVHNFFYIEASSTPLWQSPCIFFTWIQRILKGLIQFTLASICPARHWRSTALGVLCANRTQSTLCTFFHNTSQWTNRIVHMHLDRPTSLLFKHHSHPNLQALSILYNSTPTRTHTRQIVLIHRPPSTIPILMLLISLHSTKP